MQRLLGVTRSFGVADERPHVVCGSITDNPEVECHAEKRGARSSKVVLVGDIELGTCVYGGIEQFNVMKWRKLRQLTK